MFIEPMPKVGKKENGMLKSNISSPAVGHAEAKSKLRINPDDLLELRRAQAKIASSHNIEELTITTAMFGGLLIEILTERIEIT